MEEKGTLLYRRFLAGDEESLEELISLYHHGLLRFINGYVQDVGLAEDVLVDVFTTLYFKRPFQERDNATLKTYLYTIARNKSLNILKKQKRRREVSLDELQAAGTKEEKGLYLRSSILPPDLHLEKAEQKDKLYTALKNISPDYREVLLLRYFDDLSPDKIAKIVNKSNKQVYNLIARGKIALKKQLEKEEAL